MRVEVAHVAHGRDGYELFVREVPLRTLLVRQVLAWAWTATFGLTRHRLCCNAPEWMWRIGWGRPAPGDADYEPGEKRQLLRHSLAGALWHLSGWMDDGYGFAGEHATYRVPLDEAQVREHDPEFAAGIDAMLAEEEDA